jgi:hypothetical protein
MTLSKQQNVLGVSDAQIAPITANTTLVYTIGAYIELPELKSLDVTVKSVNKEAVAGFTIVDTFTIKQGYDVKFENLNIDLDVIALINGATLSASGTTPNQINSLIEKGSDIPAQFNLAFKTDLVNGAAADFHMELYCVKGLIDIVSKTDDYYTCSFTGTAYARKLDEAFRKITSNETADEIGE